MSVHRSTQPRVSNQTEISNFDPGTALENLRAELIEVEALAHAAEEAANELATPRNARQRLVIGRIQTLATKAAERASTALRYGNEQVASLSAQMAAHRARTSETAH
jgi:cystathionine beta-lyase/cystathionine gamma-synthase